MRLSKTIGRTAAATFFGGLLLMHAASPAQAAPPWQGEELPLPLSVRTPQDLAVKQVAERQYLIFNLLAGGKSAFDAGDFATAANKWEALLRLRPLDPDVEKIIRPLARDARSRVGVAAASSAPSPSVSSVSSVSTGGGPALVGGAPSAAAVPPVSVSGTIAGGGTLGPGGAVVWLKRVGGETPRPSPAKGKVISQRNKAFVPRVLAVPVGTKIDFRNEDSIFHNVFSLSKPNDFDTGLYKQGGSYTQVFKKAGPVQLLCNIHSTMVGYVYVVDSPYYGQAEANGAFNIRNVPPGDYEIEVWHEGSSKDTRQRLTVGADGVRGLSLNVAGDKRALQFVPDKSGKPRQAQVGY
ncbi:MAG TPA: carboxypeptidase regulatory-like domain-containing protein [Polyangia bacterium]|jgi:plastocyanin